MLASLDHALWNLGAWLVRMDVSLSLLLLVGMSMALSHVFSLLANRLRGRAIVIHLLLDALILALAFLLSSAIDMLLLAQFAGTPVHPSVFLDGLAPCLLPASLYVLSAAPYVGDWIALAIWVSLHLNVIVYLHVGFQLPYDEALLLSTPGFALALALVWALFHQSWQASYASLSSRLGAP